MTKVTFFGLKHVKPIVKQQVSETEQSKEIELEKHIEKGYPAYFTYIDLDGKEKVVTNSNFSKQADGSYVMTKTEVINHNIYDKVSYTYKNIDKHFSYKDNNGKVRTFNELSTLTYDGNSYSGIAGLITYKEEEVEVFQEK